MSSISQQLVRKLLKAHTVSSSSSSEGEVTGVAVPKKVQQHRPITRNDKTKYVSPSDRRIATKEEIQKVQQQIARITHRAMTSSLKTKNSKKSTNFKSKNTAAVHKLVRQRERTVQQQKQERTNAMVTNIIHSTGTARSSTNILSQSSLVKIPTFNKMRYEQERKEKKRMKLAQALEKLQHTNNTNHRAKKQPERKKTIFG